MKVVYTYDDRMALIKEVHTRRNKIQSIKNKSKNLMTKKPSIKRDFSEINIAKNTQDNINHYTDASKYAKEYYGERLKQTTRWDKDWGDY